MAFTINDIRSQLVLGGARPSQFQVTINNPVNGAADLKTPFMVKAAELPASTVGVIEVPYFGRKMKIAGDRTFAEWTVTIINDEDFLVRNAMEAWMNAINSHENNLRELGSASPLLYQSQAQVRQFSKTGLPIREYTFDGLFPTEVGAIELNWETTDTIEEFSVTFQYSEWRVSGGSTGNSTT
jgi:hypothetical protein